MYRTIFARVFAWFILTLGLATGCYTGPETLIERETVYLPAPDAGPPGESDAMAWDDSEISWDRAEPKQPDAKDGWQASGVLTTGDALKQFSMQAAFPESGDYTVQFGVTPPPDTGPGQHGEFNCLADVSWRVEGGEVRREISVGNGTTITGTAQGVHVTVRDGGALHPGNDYTVFVQVARGTRPNTQQPVTLKGVATVTVFAAGVLVVPIPRLVGVISAEVSVAPAFIAPLHVTVEQQDGSFFDVKEYDPTIETGFVAIAPSAIRLQINNNDVANAIRVSVTWGIDG